MLGCAGIWSTLLFVLLVAANELELVSMRLDGGRERCYKEQLPEKTVALFKYRLSMINPHTNQPPAVTEGNLGLQIVVKDSNGAVISSTTEKPGLGRYFFTAPYSGEFHYCFRAVQQNTSQPLPYNPNAVPEFFVEVYIGQDRDPHIIAPITVQLSDLQQIIQKGTEHAADIQREQSLQRERETHFQQISSKLNWSTLKWSALQAVVIGAAGFAQMKYMSDFFQARKLV